MNRLQGKVAIVTGGGKGIGEATALAMAVEGAKVAVADVDRAAGESVVSRIQADGGEAFFQPTNVGVMADVERLVAATVERYGKLDIIVNNAGIAVTGTAAEMSEEDWDKVININLTGVWRGMRAALPHMLRQGSGSIINLSSVQALAGFLGWSGYAATKGGVIALTQQAAVEYAPQGVRVNAIAPGTIMTPMNIAMYNETPDFEATVKLWGDMHPVRRVGEASEVAAAIVFLASDEASFITGVTLRVDGGLAIKGG